ncbi:MAG: helix-turn-helix domain-containing protein [Desulfobacteraceae bacterium]|nr:helix-turn-helix domain-containing protein [Desulfobacteraceae bacterium]MBC2751925.1 helix-turn-helix domain-containing protein [Desulfobacteraceae bacterium]
MDSLNRLLNEKEVAEYLGIGVQTLRNWRYLRRGPVYYKLGSRVSYSEKDIIDYINHNRIIPKG